MRFCNDDEEPEHTPPFKINDSKTFVLWNCSNVCNQTLIRARISTAISQRFSHFLCSIRQNCWQKRWIERRREKKHPFPKPMGGCHKQFNRNCIVGGLMLNTFNSKLQRKIESFFSPFVALFYFFSAFFLLLFSFAVWRSRCSKLFNTISNESIFQISI